MTNRFDVEEWTPGRKLWLRTPGEYSTELGAGILSWLNEQPGSSIPDQGWTSAGFGNLVENGISVEIDSIEFCVMCSHEDLFIERISGNNRKFSDICDAIRSEFGTS